MLCVMICVLMCSVPLNVLGNQCGSIDDSQMFDVTTFDPINAPPPDLIKMNGYTCETHTVETEDGYILQVYRIPGGKKESLKHCLAPVLLQHGLLGSSADWIICGPNRSLAYLLADEGYDVWLGNARGCTYSRAHRTLNVTDQRFWNFTYHEMGYYDQPAVIDYILEWRSDHDQLYYIGHSMGTTQFYVLTTTRPEYNSKVRYMVALSPISYFQHTTSPVRVNVLTANLIEVAVDTISKGSFFSRNPTFDAYLRVLCGPVPGERRICPDILYFIGGYDPEQLDESLIPMIFGHFPAGCSVKTFTHYAQLIGEGSSLFQQFDYGPQGNLLEYNSTTPPRYNLSLITVPMSLIYGDNDLIATPTDVFLLSRDIPNSPHEVVRVNFTSFSHFDFIVARDVKSLVYDFIIDRLHEFRFYG